MSYADDYMVNVPSWQSDIVPGIIELNISSQEPGDKLEVNHSGSLVRVYQRTDEELKFIRENYSGATPVVADAIVERIER